MYSVFDIFKIGIGPSSSHTVGPMLAARTFAGLLEQNGELVRVARLRIDLYGSLALTGEGHGTVAAVLSGLEGNTPDVVDTETVPLCLQRLQQPGACLQLAGCHAVPYNHQTDLQLHKHLFLPKHPNGLRLTALNPEGEQLLQETYYSVGGGFVLTDAEFGQRQLARIAPPHVFASGAQLLALCRKNGKTIAQIMFENELTWQSEAAVRNGLLHIADVMRQSREKGCATEGLLPGPYQIRRRAAGIFRRMLGLQLAGRQEFMLWPMVYAIAVAEENAAGGRVVTAPTNGAAGIVPAVLQFHRNFSLGASEQSSMDFLLTAAAIAMIYKMNASISGAEVGCQGEVGVACSMAAGAYCAVLGGSLDQIENAAEIAMEHHLGLTCDPVGGQVQIPCVERNGIAAEKAIKAAQLAYLGSGEHKVSLDAVVATMYRTGMDMQNSYKETSLGGLAQTLAMPAC